MTKNLNIPDLDLQRVVVVGGGFAGIRLVRKLNTKAFQVVLIDKHNYHTFQPLMYQVATAGLEPDSIAYPLRKLLKRKKNGLFRLAEVLSVDTSSKQIKTNIGILDYDILVIATGAANNFFGNTNIERYSYPMKDLVESLDLRNKILKNFELALNESDLVEREALMNFVIVGGGPYRC